MRQTDEAPHPAAVARARQERVRFWAGLVIAAGGLAAVFMLGEVYFGFAVALLGAGIVPIEKIGAIWKR